MKFADRLKFNATGASAALLTAGTAIAGCRTLAQAIADGALAVNDSKVPFTVTDGTAWEDSLYTITSATQLTRTQVLASSAGGTTPATFSASLTAYNTVPGSVMSRVSVDSDVAFSQSIPLTQPGTAWMPPQTVSGALSFTPAANAVKGAFAYVRLVADGVNAPTFPGFTEEIGSAGYDNRNGIVNRIAFSYDGSDYWYVVSQAATATAAATAITMTGPTAGVVSTASSNFTVALTPVGGSVSGSVTVTPNDGGAGGTFSPASVGLTTSSPSATFTYTPNATAGTKTVGVANNAQLANPAAINYTTTAQPAEVLTVSNPGAQTAGSPFTLAGTYSNGTPTALDYSTDGGTTWTAAASPVIASGNYSFSATVAGVNASQVIKVRDHAIQTAIGTSSAFSVGAASTFVRLNQLNHVLETGTGPYSYVGDGSGTFGAAFGGLSTTGLQAGTDGWLSFVVGKYDNTSEPMIGLTTGSTVVVFGSLPYAFYPQFSSNKYMPWTAGTLGTPTNNVVPAVGDVMRLHRVGTNVIAEVSKDGGGTWTTVYTWTGASTAAMKFQLLPEYSAQMNNLASSGLA